MGRVKWNIATNLLSRFWGTGLAFLLVPVYIKFLGIEAYGLVGFYTTLQAVFAVLDLGLAATMTREMARIGDRPDQAAGARDLVRTLETVYWSVAFLIALFVLAASHWIATGWVNAEDLDPARIARSIMLMGAVMGLRWPGMLYEGGLMGLQRQVLRNTIVMVVSGVRALGAVLVLWLVSPTVEAFFGWQLLTSGMQTACAGWALWRALPVSSKRPSFRVERLRAVWRFAAGMSAISALGLVLVQMDKLIVSKVLPLSTFGYYTLAGTAAAALLLPVSAIYEALYPKLTRAAEDGDTKALAASYHEGAQLISALLAPAAAVLILFAPELLALWTRNEVTVANTRVVLAVLASGTAINGMLFMPLALQLAHGWTTLSVWKCVIAVPLMLPTLWFLTRHFGPTGAAASWVITNGAFLAFEVSFMHRRLLRGERARWYLQDVALPAAVAVGIVGIARTLVSSQQSSWVSLPFITIAGAVAVSACLAAMPFTRARLRSLRG